jgi:hypothetical protein
LALKVTGRRLNKKNSIVTQFQKFILFTNIEKEVFQWVTQIKRHFSWMFAKVLTCKLDKQRNLEIADEIFWS